MSLPGQFIIICLARPVVSQLVNFLEESRVDKTFPSIFPAPRNSEILCTWDVSGNSSKDYKSFGGMGRS